MNFPDTPRFFALNLPLPEKGIPVGYAALMIALDLKVPVPKRLSAVAERFHPVSDSRWTMVEPRRAPEQTLAGHLYFAFENEGIELPILKALFDKLTHEDLEQVLSQKPTSPSARRLWFLYEWMTGEKLDLDGLSKRSFIPLLNPNEYFALPEGTKSPRHKVINNLPGTQDFCPLVRKTEALLEFDLEATIQKLARFSGEIHPDVLRRAAAFLLLDDSKASFHIEGESPSADRANRWGAVIGEAGSAQLTVSELERLQAIVVGDGSFARHGLRKTGGFVGKRDRRSYEPIPSHISARHEDLPVLVQGICNYADRALASGMHPVAIAAAVSFGFVYVHPFEDGNGRLHRWLIHHVLARAGFNPPGLIFPISAVMLREIPNYRRVLETHSAAILPHIEWRATEDHNIEVLNDTRDFYRFFDATPHTEFLAHCIAETMVYDLPNEIRHVIAHDTFTRKVQQLLGDMPQRIVDLLAHRLLTGNGVLSRRAREREFDVLRDDQIASLEELFRECYEGVQPPPQH